MIKSLKEKLGCKTTDNKGFTLVELIVVIVILAILIGVTIGGVYGYVNKSRINTDINNASAIQSTVSLLGVDKDVFKSSPGKADAASTIIEVTWTDAIAAADLPAKFASASITDLGNKVAALVTDGFPESKAGGSFKLTLGWDKNGGFTCSCVALDSSGTRLVAAE